MDYLTYEEYSTICNRIVGWLTLKEKDFNKRDIYGYFGRDADCGTVERVALERYQAGDFSEDGLITEYFECAVVDNDDYSFMPLYVKDQDGNKYDIATVMDMARRASAYEVNNGRSPSIVYLENPNPEPEPQPEPTPEPTPVTGGSHYHILDMDASPADRGFAQCTDYFCACNSVQCLIKYHTGRYISEYTLASVGGTTTSGTGHYGIECMIDWFNRNYPEQLTIEWANFGDYGFEGVAALFEQDSTGVFFHNLRKNQWGHYSILREIDMDNEVVVEYNSLSGGNLEEHSFGTWREWLGGISQPSLCIIRRVE